MVKARLLHRSRTIYPDGALREMVLWQVSEASTKRRHGLKCRLYYGDTNSKCLVRYDNETGKGDHRHIGNKEEHYHFTDVESLVADFQHDIDRLRG